MCMPINQYSLFAYLLSDMRQPTAGVTELARRLDAVRLQQVDRVVGLDPAAEVGRHHDPPVRTRLPFHGGQRRWRPDGMDPDGR